MHFKHAHITNYRLSQQSSDTAAPVSVGLSWRRPKCGQKQHTATAPPGALSKSSSTHCEQQMLVHAQPQKLPTGQQGHLGKPPPPFGMQGVLYHHQGTNCWRAGETNQLRKPQSTHTHRSGAAQFPHKTPGLERRRAQPTCCWNWMHSAPHALQSNSSQYHFFAKCRPSRGISKTPHEVITWQLSTAQQSMRQHQRPTTILDQGSDTLVTSAYKPHNSAALPKLQQPQRGFVSLHLPQPCTNPSRIPTRRCRGTATATTTTSLPARPPSQPLPRHRLRRPPPRTPHRVRLCRHTPEGATGTLLRASSQWGVGGTPTL